MAYTLTGAFEVHQTLHGYSDGHRLVAKSMNVSQRDARRMLMLSDLAGPGLKPGDEGYLTCYPLSESGYYVFARTWPAPEMSRPGCVWTHSLLIEFADLATIARFDSLLETTRRPPSGEFESYEQPLPIEASDGLPSGIELGGAGRRLVSAIYSAPKSSIVCGEIETIDPIPFTLALWGQQWPRLRRNFAFCTATATDRSTETHPFDLQFTKIPKSSRRSRFPVAVLCDEATEDRELEPVFADLERPNVTGFRDFLRMTGGDVEKGRSAMRALCAFHDATHADIPARFTRAVTALDELGTGQARSARESLLQAAVDRIEQIDEPTFGFVLRAMQEVGDTNSPIFSERIGAEIWRRSPRTLVSHMNEDNQLGLVSRSVVSSLAEDDLIAGLFGEPGIIAPIVSARPTILSDERFWRLPVEAREFEPMAISTDPDEIAKAMMKAGRLNDAVHLAEHLSLPVVERLFEACIDDDMTRRRLLRILLGEPERIAKLLIRLCPVRRDILVEIAKTAHPEFPTSQKGGDPWLRNLTNSRGTVSSRDEDYLAAFAFARAVSRASRDRAQLFAFSFDRLDKALTDHRLDWSTNRLVIDRIPSGFFSLATTRTRYHRRVVEAFVSDGLDPAVFGWLSRFEKSTKCLYEEAASTGAGKRYLSMAAEALTASRRKGAKARANYISKLLKH